MFVAELDVRIGWDWIDINGGYGLVVRPGGDMAYMYRLGGFGLGVQIPCCFFLYMSVVVKNQRNFFIEGFSVCSGDTAPVIETVGSENTKKQKRQPA